MQRSSARVLFELSHDRCAAEPFFHARGHELRGHYGHRLIRHHARAESIAFAADIERDIEENCLDLTAVSLVDFYVGLAYVDGEMRGIDVRHRASNRQPLAKKISDGGENTRVNGLVCSIIRQ